MPRFLAKLHHANLGQILLTKAVGETRGPNRVSMITNLFGEALTQVQRDLGLTVKELAGALDVDPRTVARWLEAGAFPQREARQRIESLEGFRHHLLEVCSSPEAARHWMHAPNRYLSGLTPAEAAKAGRVDRIEAALVALESGIFV